jgi:hypothetical protein
MAASPPQRKDKHSSISAPALDYLHLSLMEPALLSPDFNSNFGFGQAGESLLARYLRRRGNSVLPAYEKIIDTGKWTAHLLAGWLTAQAG